MDLETSTKELDSGRLAHLSVFALCQDCNHGLDDYPAFSSRTSLGPRVGHRLPVCPLALHDGLCGGCCCYALQISRIEQGKHVKYNLNL
jgi:hypothetical protein